MPIVFAQEPEDLLVMGGPQADGLILPSGVSVDPDNNFLIINDGTNDILSLTEKLDYRFRFGGYSTSFEKVLDAPAHIIFSKKRMIISDIGCLKVFDLKGNLEEIIKNIGDETLKRPMGLSTDSRNRIYISDPELGKVIICESDFSPYKVIESIVEKPVHCFVTSSYRHIILDTGLKKGIVLSSYLEKISDFGDFKNPKSIVTDGSRRIFVLDENSIHSFSISGDSRQKWKLSPKKPEGLYPSMVLIEDSIYLTSHESCEFLEFDTTSGKVKTIIEQNPNNLILPSCQVTDENGRIYVSDTLGDRIRVVNQQGDTLFNISSKRPGRMTISRNFLAVIENNEYIQVYTREGGALYKIEELNPVDLSFISDDSLLVMTSDGHVKKYIGTEDADEILDDEKIVANSIILDSAEDYFAIASSDKSVSVFSRFGDFEWSIKTSSIPRDVLILSSGKVIVAYDSGLKLIDRFGKVIESFGEGDGLFSEGIKTEKEINYQKELSKFTKPVSISRFGDWIYVLDNIAMRLTRFNKQILLSPPEIKISPEILDFGSVPAGDETEASIVIENIGGETLEGSFSVIPRWVISNSKRFKGDDVIIKLKTRTNHFIGGKTYRENIVIDSNAGKVIVPCIIGISDISLNQVDIIIHIGDTKVEVGDEVIDLGIAPYIKDGKTMVPLRFISEAFGGSVEFDDGYIDVSFPQKDLWVSLELGKEDVILGIGEESKFLTISPPPQIKSGTTFVPLTFFTDILNCEYYWDSKTKSIRLVYILD
ncbi:MAG: stalk domain-containing protein [Caldisericia bacterium]